jgi:lipopolysaccharide transport system permease protein
LVFLASGWAIWQYFSSVLIQSTQVYQQNSALLRKVYFPRVLLPLSKVFGALPELLIGLLVGALLAAFEQPFRAQWLASIPIAALAAFFCVLGPALLMSCAAALWRDLSFGFPALVQLLFFLSPVAYGAKRLSGLPGLQFNPILPALDLQHLVWFGSEQVLGGWEAALVGIVMIALGAIWSWKLGPKLSERL